MHVRLAVDWSECFGVMGCEVLCSGGRAEERPLLSRVRKIKATAYECESYANLTVQRHCFRCWWHAEIRGLLRLVTNNGRLVLRHLLILSHHELRGVRARAVAIGAC